LPKNLGLRGKLYNILAFDRFVGELHIYSAVEAIIDIYFLLCIIILELEI
jgi:hypothetical protein